VVVCASPHRPGGLSASAARDAARLAGARQALSYLSRLNYNIQPHFEAYNLEAALAPARELIGEEAYQGAFAEGQALSLDQAVALALECMGAAEPPSRSTSR
jgi:hypothetical protein